MGDPTNRVYVFGAGDTEGGQDLVDLLGGKGAGLAEMTRLGIPVPPGFTITTATCRAFLETGDLPRGLEDDVMAGLARVEAQLGRRFGDPTRPLLVSVRSGAAVSMPGMMDTILNLGLNDETVLGLARESGSRRFAYDTYRRFIQMYECVVLGLDGHLFEDALLHRKRARGATTDLDLDADDLEALVADFRAIGQRTLGRDVPTHAREQLFGSIRAVFRSWNTPRAATYRKIHGIADDLGTACSVVAMVYGNMGEQSATGVVFTRNPSTGESAPFGEYLVNAQGEDVVAGIRTPAPLNEASRARTADGPSLEALHPALYADLRAKLDCIEAHYKDMQDVEFTIEEGRLFILQTRAGKRTGRAAVRIALALLDAGVIDEEEALLRVDAIHHMKELLHPTIDPRAPLPKPLVTGLAASPGAATGKVSLTADEAVRSVAAGEKVVLVRHETSADDIHGMHAAEGFLTATGGMTSHAAVVARGMGRPCVAGAGAVVIAHDEQSFAVGDKTVQRGDLLTIDGTRGLVYLGTLPLVLPEIGDDLARFLAIADRHRRLKVRANADTPEDALRARRFGAEGIGLCRTEHMFFEPKERLQVMRATIFASEDGARAKALEKLGEAQRDDFRRILAAMDGLPVVVRLLDPPIHEFLPRAPQDVKGVAETLGVTTRDVEERIERTREQNPMLGHRGCRLGITFPEIYLMQVEALVRAAIDEKRAGHDPHMEIMIPLVADETELAYLRERIVARVDACLVAANTTLHYEVGTMIELPRAALTAGKIARHADFFSFGTNDLTQATFGISRDDSARFLPYYVERGIFPEDPFASLDQTGVGELVEIGLTRGRAARPGLIVGICGEHGGEPRSIAFCDRIGLDYVSCSPFRVPVARLAAAQAAIQARRARGMTAV